MTQAGGWPEGGSDTAADMQPVEACWSQVVSGSAGWGPKCALAATVLYDAQAGQLGGC
jgi:hypothetical protein